MYATGGHGLVNYTSVDPGIREFRGFGDAGTVGRGYSVGKLSLGKLLTPPHLL